MPGIPIALCGINPAHADFVVEHLKPEFEVVAIFTTPEAAMNDLPMLLSLNSTPKHADSSSEDESYEPNSISSTASFHKQTFSLALDPTALDPGTIPISASTFNVSAKQPGAVAAVVSGAGFNEHGETIVKSCEDVKGKVTWFRTDTEKSKEQGLEGRTKTEDLGGRVMAALEQWMKETEVEAKVRKGKGASRYF